MQAFQWHGGPSLTATKLAFSRPGVLLDYLFLFLSVLESYNVSSLPRCWAVLVPTYLGWIEKQGAGYFLQARFPLSFRQLTLGRGGTAAMRRGIEYRPSMELPRRIGWRLRHACARWHANAPMACPSAMSRLESHRKTVGSEENANYLRLIINRRDTANPRQSLTSVLAGATPAGQPWVTLCFGRSDSDRQPLRSS